MHFLLVVALLPMMWAMSSTKAEEALTFFFYGDWGNNVPAALSESGIAYEGHKVAIQVTKSAEELKPSFFVMLGDNFYDNGVVSTVDPLWQKYYRDLYTNPATQVPWYPVLGNHDYYGTHTPLAQVEYTRRHVDHRWNLPDNFYTKTFNIPHSKKTLEIFFVDTVILAPNGKDPAKTGLPPANPDGSTSDVQKILLRPYLKWLEENLAASTAEYKIVAGHYHVYTVTDGDDTTLELEQYLVPLMKKYGVQAYMNGHEHNAEHLYFEGIHYLTAGHGCDKDDPLSPLPWTQKGALTGHIVGPHAEGVRFAKDIGSFGVMEASDSTLSFSFVDEKGNKLYSADIVSKKKKSFRG